ncbi:MAG: glycosyl hydrolase [Candidatus Fischerbacteria bacterium RBG_13_37_8]|uniref:Glycosyl hydrolase n=1 Tax=Candidatus Fischerbacteria bacterium RBG_13_37_8 TaxID=1817863 RepID=A0A1F5V983_9BACT|nr:MAG: glycosyl hydrolase [Candidatus Fischerbacteria bacterium RBG_13_37_8]
MKKLIIISVIIAVCISFSIAEEKTGKNESSKDKETIWKADTFSGLKLRGIGPAVYSGRVSDIAVHPKQYSTYYVAVASGNVWKTINAGTTWSPVFDSYGSYSIGCITIDPNDPLVVWVGTGENNSQRSVGYGDGVYKSLDGGKTWENMGLKNSEHIGKILVDPRDSRIVYVAAQGPLWNSGGDRGLYKTTDGGKTWKQVLKISENTGVSDIVMDPRNPDIIFATAYQRRRHVWTLINGGPESAIHKTTDAGTTWKKLENGLPKEEMGRIALAIPSTKPDTVYALIELAGKGGGLYRSNDAGANWEKTCDYDTQSAQYYQELIPDPVNPERVYSMDTWMMVTEDGGKTFHKVGEKYKHVDNHALWIEPENTDHMLAGCDGGVYESWDRGATWDYKPNLPVMQFYRVTVDNAFPFYNIYGGTQDNQTVGGPSRTSTSHGIINSDWFTTVGGDGFYTQVDPKDPNIVYSEWQYGGLIRFDKLTGEVLDIRPQPGMGEPALRFNWDSPLLLSPHSHTRLYFAANILFRSDDRGDNWKAVSPDLTRQLDRNKLKVMGKVWSVDTVAKNASTSFYGNIVSLDESPLKEGLLYVGTDDGLIQVSEDSGANWRKIEKFPGVPDMSYVARINASLHDTDTVYAAFDNHKMGDFKPYILKSTDRGQNWTLISGDLPERGNVYALAQDHEKADLLFAGTEFGLFFTVDGGKKWLQLKGGMPIIAVRDIAIQRRENDLVAGTFGRGFYILDDYSPLRSVSEAYLNKEAHLLPVKKAWMFIPSEPLGLKEKSFQGDSFYTAPNPPFGAVFTYYLKEELKTKKKIRQEKEKQMKKEGKDIFYPTWEELEAEAREEEPVVLLTVTDEEGNVVRRLTGPVSAGFNRVAWDLRLPPADPTDLKPPAKDNPFVSEPIGPMVVPGTYKVNMAKRVNGEVTPLSDTQTFTTTPLKTASLPEPDRTELLTFSKKTARLQRAVLGAVDAMKEAKTRTDHLKKAIDDTPGADPKLADEARMLETRLKDLKKLLTGDSLRDKFNEPTPTSIVDRVQSVVYGYWTTTSAPTGTHRRAYEIAASEFAQLLEQMRTLIEKDLKNLEDKAEAAGAPYTPGRFPTWKQE